MGAVVIGLDVAISCMQCQFVITGLLLLIGPLDWSSFSLFGLLFAFLWGPFGAHFWSKTNQKLRHHRKTPAQKGGCLPWVPSLELSPRLSLRADDQLARPTGIRKQANSNIVKGLNSRAEWALELSPSQKDPAFTIHYFYTHRRTLTIWIRSIVIFGIQRVMRI